MKITYKYKIYWFEDADWLESEIEKLKEKYDDPKVEFEINSFNSADGVEKIFSTTEIDILLMDWNLKKGSWGNELIDHLRAKGVLCDIIFYSENPKFDENLKNREGIHTTARKNLGSELYKKIDKHRLLIENVSTMRGHFITSAIDLEVKLNNIIAEFFELNSDKEIFLKENFLEKEFFSFQKKYATVNRISKIVLKKCREAYSVNNGEEKEELKKEMVRCEQSVSVIKEFEKQIIDIRNTLAHSKDKFGPKGETIFTHITSGKEEIINEKWVRDKMKNLVMHSINLDRIHSLI